MYIKAKRSDLNCSRIECMKPVTNIYIICFYLSTAIVNTCIATELSTKAGFIALI